MNDKSRKAEILRPSSGTSRVFVRCTARARQHRKFEHQSLSIYAVEVLARLNETIDAIESAYREYHFNMVAQHLYNFVWSDYCDWFVEAAKTDIFSEDEAKKKSALAVMDVVLSATLRLLHPFMPHLTEEIWSLLGLGKDSIQFAAPPEKLALDAVADVAERRRLVSSIYETVQAGRNLRSASKLPSNRKIRFILRTNDKTISEQTPTLSRLLNAEELTLDPKLHGAGWHSSSSHSLRRTFSRDRRCGPSARTRAVGQGNREDW